MNSATAKLGAKLDAKPDAKPDANKTDNNGKVQAGGSSSTKKNLHKKIHNTTKRVNVLLSRFTCRQKHKINYTHRLNHTRRLNHRRY